jgi:hypothetical protein
VIAIAARMLLAGDNDEGKASRLTASCGLALIALGPGISLGELAIGFTIGLACRATAIAALALLPAQPGLAAGTRAGERWRGKFLLGRFPSAARASGLPDALPGRKGITGMRPSRRGEAGLPVSRVGPLCSLTGICLCVVPGLSSVS